MLSYSYISDDKYDSYYDSKILNEKIIRERKKENYFLYEKHMKSLHYFPYRNTSSYMDGRRNYITKEEICRIIFPDDSTPIIQKRLRKANKHHRYNILFEPDSKITFKNIELECCKHNCNHIDDDCFTITYEVEAFILNLHHIDEIYKIKDIEYPFYWISRDYFIENFKNIFLLS